MSRILAHPWRYPPGKELTHRLVKLTNLDPGTDWEKVKHFFDGYKIQLYHFFGTQGLVQFLNASDAVKYIHTHNFCIPELHATVTLSSIPQMVFPRTKPKSRVICIRIIRVRAFVGIHDIYDECSNFGNVLRIICFEKQGRYALVEMETEEQAAVVFVNIQKTTKFAPTFELRVQYSTNEKIHLTSNNSKSFDFTVPGAEEAFDLVRQGLTGEQPFFSPDSNEMIPKQLDYFRPVQFDPAFGNSLNITKIPLQTAEFFKNLIAQYGVVIRVKTVVKEHDPTAFVQMRTGFFARLAMFHLNQCPLLGKKMKVEISIHRDVHPETSAQNGQVEFVEYDEEADDPDLYAYSQMWCPSKYVGIRPQGIKASDLELPKGNYQIDEKLNCFVFPTIDLATNFIGSTTPKSFNEVPTILYFMKPPK